MSFVVLFVEWERVAWAVPGGGGGKVRYGYTCITGIGCCNFALNGSATGVLSPDGLEFGAIIA